MQERALRGERDGFDADPVIVRAERTAVGGEGEAEIVGRLGQHAVGELDLVSDAGRLVELPADVHAERAAVGARAARLDIEMQDQDVAPARARLEGALHARERIVEHRMHVAVELAGRLARTEVQRTIERIALELRLQRCVLLVERVGRAGGFVGPRRAGREAGEAGESGSGNPALHIVVEDREHEDEE